MTSINFKVGYLFFKDLLHRLPNNLTFNLDENVIFSTEVDKVDDKIWHDWLGLKWNNVQESNAMIKIEIPTDTPDVLDGENKKLTELCEKAYIALQLTGDFKVDVINFFTGSKVAGKINIRQWGEYDNWYCSPYFKKLANKDLEMWSKLLKRLLFFYAGLTTHKFVRFNRGLMHFQKGCREYRLDFRLPYFVRSLEALALPDKHNTGKQFKKRIARCWPKQFKGDAVSILGEIYDMRCDFEHLHGIKQKYNASQLLRSYQCETITRNAFQTILFNDQELEMFSTDEDIRKYWEQIH